MRCKVIATALLCACTTFGATAQPQDPFANAQWSAPPGYRGPTAGADADLPDAVRYHR